MIKESWRRKNEGEKSKKKKIPLIWQVLCEVWKYRQPSVHSQK